MMTEQSRRLELAANHLYEAVRLSLEDDPTAATVAEDVRTAYLWLAGRYGWLAPDNTTPPQPEQTP